MANSSSPEFFDEFDEVTLTKLDIYEHYLQEWLPVPLSGRMYVPKACIFDLFCGPGSDTEGNKGSPLRARDIILKNAPTILNSSIPIEITFNDFNEKYVEILTSTVGDQIIDDSGNLLAKVFYESRSFDDLFPVAAQSMRGSANLLFIDQFGVAQIDENRFREINKLPMTDVLFFIDSTWFRRFADRPEAASWGIDKDQVMGAEFRHIHRFMTDHFRGLVGTDYHVAPFSLKKGSNIYGLIFASHDWLGLEKFLKVAWRTDPHTGEANYDLFNDGTGNPDQGLLFGATKIADFEADLNERLVAQGFTSDRDIYFHMLENGFLATHTRHVVMQARKNNLIRFRDQAGKDVQPRLSNDCVREPRRAVFPD